MKHTKKYIGAAAFAMFAGLMASCTNELDAPTAGGNTPGNTTTGVNIVKAPDVVAWSGEQTLGNVYSVAGYNTRTDFYSGNAGDGQDVGQGQTNQLWKPFKNPTLVAADEKDKVLAALAEKTLNGRRGYIHEEIVFPWENYFLQDVLRGVDSDCPSKSWTLFSYNDYKTSGQPYEMVTNNGQITNHCVFMNGNQQVRSNNTALMVNMGVGQYDEMAGYQFYFHMGCHENQDWFDSYIVVEVEGNYYICVDFACVHEDKDNGNEMRWHDWDYNDWIIKISPAIPVDDPGYKVPDVWTSDNHLGGDDNNDDDNNGDDNNGDDDNTITYYHDNEVEVNYAILDSHDNLTVADLVTKLSIHVRKATDVEIIIPIPTKYVIESDDLYIFQEHYTGSYGGSQGDLLDKNVNQTVTYNVAGTSVDLHVDFIEGGEDGGYIKVWTNGIDETVISYLMEKNGDGINFEVYNYFQTSKKVWNDGDDYTDGNHSTVEAIQTINRKDLLKAMNESTISFMGEYPHYYINAFGWNDNKSGKHEAHATVTPIDRTNYPSFVTTTHLNSTPFNNIYTLKGVEADHAHKEN